jgi:hypothetical protein
MSGFGLHQLDVRLMLVVQRVPCPLKVGNQRFDAVARKSIELRRCEAEIVGDLRVEFSALFTHGLTAGTLAGACSTLSHR